MLFSVSGDGGGGGDWFGVDSESESSGGVVFEVGGDKSVSDGGEVLGAEAI